MSSRIDRELALRQIERVERRRERAAQLSADLKQFKLGVPVEPERQRRIEAALLPPKRWPT